MCFSVPNDSAQYRTQQQTNNICCACDELHKNEEKAFSLYLLEKKLYYYLAGKKTLYKQTDTLNCASCQFKPFPFQNRRHINYFIYST